MSTTDFALGTVPDRRMRGCRARHCRIVWIDADTIIMDLPFQMPFHLYKNKSFIAWGNEDYLLAGNQRHGANIVCSYFCP